MHHHLFRLTRRLAAASLLLTTILTAHAQTETLQAPCGVVDAIAYPVDDLAEVTIARGYDDFGLFRGRWGGRHTGLDMAFGEQGAPVRAAARGRVTLSNIEEWDTERGVVIVEHIFPDGSTYYTLYGHMEETDEISFPAEGSCVELGDPVGAVGDPENSAPHMHFEVRDFLPNEGGPGYVEENPLLQGWYHPLDFIYLWQARLAPGFVDHVSFAEVPTVPPVEQANGIYVTATGDSLMGVAAPSTQVIWRVSTDGTVIGLAALGENRIAAVTDNGQALIMDNGRYVAVWNVETTDTPFVQLNDNTLVFPTPGGGLVAYGPDGQQRWTVQAAADRSATVAYFEGTGTQFVLTTDTGDDLLWRLFDAAGTVLYETTYERWAVTAPGPMQSWAVVADGSLHRISAGEDVTLTRVDFTPGRRARLTVDLIGNMYLFVGDASDTLIAWDSGGGVRWRETYSAQGDLLRPMMDTDTGCLLYLMDTEGRLNVFDTANGQRVQQTQLYPGGFDSRRPSARTLRVDEAGRVHASPGFLTTITLDGNVLGASVIDGCLLG